MCLGLFCFAPDSENLFFGNDINVWSICVPKLTAVVLYETEGLELDVIFGGIRLSSYTMQKSTETRNQISSWTCFRNALNKNNWFYV